MPKMRSKNGYEYFVDQGDVALVSQYSWCAHKGTSTWYLMAHINGAKVRMHRLILGLTDRLLWCDHINKNGLDNRRANLRVATPAQNVWNSTKPYNKVGYRGVSLMQKNKPGSYRAVLVVNGKRIRSHRSYDPVELARWYDRMARKYHGEFATLNFPEET